MSPANSLILGRNQNINLKEAIYNIYISYRKKKLIKVMMLNIYIVKRIETGFN